MIKNTHLIVTLIFTISISIYQSFNKDMTMLFFIFPLIINLINFFVALILKKTKLIFASLIMLIFTYISFYYWGIIFSKLNDFEKVTLIDNLIYNFTSNFATIFGFVNFWIYYYFDNKIINLNK
jgi:hypothetical protein